MSDQKKKFNPSISPLKKSRNGNFSWIVTPEVLEQLNNQVHIGGRLLVRTNPQNTKVDAYLDFIPKEEVESFSKENAPAEESI